ncbi:PilW family protein [Variovorax sp. Sphag1AA]|uniref:PilW family protein n=1 Tax=Variovorax sp. Sphag1AA TaxID=2587027 RepID=UPI0016113765|nr:PilW family protein [Variovorax sp. Sphag1AA]MBB3180506.1 type IV pilus assembly protein PilW [Variovorax sp. Sphag1AA]
MNRQTPSLRQSLAQQSGLGLIELLIAVTIGLFIVLGLSALFLNMKQAYTSQDQLAQLQDNERLALTILTTTIQSAGYFPDPLTNTAATALPAASGTGYGAFAAGQGVVGLTGASGSSDTITSRYITTSGDGIMDCLGNVNPAASPAVNKLVMNTFTISANYELLCSNDGGTTTTPLVSGIKSMTVLYGIDTLGDGQALQYLDGATVTTKGWWPQARTARVTVNLVNPFYTSATIGWTQVINLMNRS